MGPGGLTPQAYEVSTTRMPPERVQDQVDDEEGNGYADCMSVYHPYSALIAYFTIDDFCVAVITCEHTPVSAWPHNRRSAEETRKAGQENSWSQGIRTSHMERGMGGRVATAQHSQRRRREIRGTRIAM